MSISNGNGRKLPQNSPGAILGGAVSSENVEIFRQAMDDWNQGDVDAVVTTWDPEIVMRTDPHRPDGAYHGVTAVRDWYENSAELLGGHAEVVIEAVFDLGDRVMARMRRDVAGGAQEELAWTQVITFRRGKAIVIESFLEHESALEALGLD
jgi:ketosteroid isomerase-like protein